LLGYYPHRNLKPFEKWLKLVYARAEIMVPTDSKTAASHNLARMLPGASAIIQCITAEEPVAKRLADMGFVRGARVTKLRAGRPGLVRIGTTCVGLGLPLQACVMVSPPELLTDPS
jgi:Fe2+ transport system protein FeoA